MKGKNHSKYLNNRILILMGMGKLKGSGKALKCNNCVKSTLCSFKFTSIVPSFFHNVESYRKQECYIGNGGI